jgi:hypothetical protein
MRIHGSRANWLKLPLVLLALVVSGCVPALIGVGVCAAGVGAYLVVDNRKPASVSPDAGSLDAGRD